MAYQTFPWQQGSSRSFEKLVSLYLPDLKGKRVLDVGCNAGFFCGWASFQGASRVVGVDNNPVWLHQAKEWFPECIFLCKSWAGLGPSSYDLILCLSAIHYADDQKKLIDLLMSRLAPDGLLVLEIGIAPGEGSRFVEVERAVDSRLFPTQDMVDAMLEGYAVKRIGPGVQQGGDPTPRYVYHITHARPLAVLLMDEHYSGKSSVASALLRPGLPVISGDALLRAIAAGGEAAAGDLKDVIRYVEGTEFINSAAVTNDICTAGLLGELLDVVVAKTGPGSFALDMYIPRAYQVTVSETLHARGYFVVAVSLPSGAADKSWLRRRTPFEQMQAYMDFLAKISAIDEEDYLAANPDVAEAVRKGVMSSGRYHYWNFGRREGRKLKPDS